MGPHPDYKFGSIQRIDRATGAATTLYTECDGHKLSAPNDLVFDKAGGMYFTDLGKRYARHRDHGGLYYALPDGSKIVCLAYPILSPNGCGLSPDGKVLYAADTEGARLWAFDVEGPGSCASRRSRASWWPASPDWAASAFRQPGGMANGNIAVATLTTGMIWISPTARSCANIPTRPIFAQWARHANGVHFSDSGRLGP
jgi:gluconolactonase